MQTLAEAGLPAGVANLVLGAGPGTGGVLSAHPGRRPGQLHRRPGDRARGDGGRRPDGQAGRARARRQEPERRLRRRRPGDRAGLRPDRRLPALRPGLLRRRPAAGRGRDRRRVRRRAGRPGAADPAGRAGGRGRGDGPADLGGAPRQGRGVRRGRARRGRGAAVRGSAAHRPGPGRRLLLPPDRAGRVPQRHAGGARGVLRAGADRRAVLRGRPRRGRGRRRRAGQRLRLRPGGCRLDRRRRSRGAGGGPAADGHGVDQRLPPVRAAGRVGRLQAVGRRTRARAVRARRVPGDQARVAQHRPQPPAVVLRDTRESSASRGPGGPRDERPDVRRRRRRRRFRRLRAREPPQRRPVGLGPRARGRAQRLPPRPAHPHAGRAAVPDREPALRLALPLRARAAHGRPDDLPRAGQGARRLQQHQRDDLPARQPRRLPALGRGAGDGAVGLRALPALLPADGDVPRRGGRVARRQRAARPGARARDQPALRGVLRGRPAGRAPPDRRRERLPAGGLRPLRPQRAPRAPAERRPGLPAPGPLAAQPHRPHARARHRAPHPDGRRPAAGRRGRLPARRAVPPRPGRRGDPVRRRPGHAAAAAAVGDRPGRGPPPAGHRRRRRPARGRREPAGPPRGLHPARERAAGVDRAVAQAPAQAARRGRVALPARRRGRQQPLRGRRLHPQQRRPSTTRT